MRPTRHSLCLPAVVPTALAVMLTYTTKRTYFSSSDRSQRREGGKSEPRPAANGYATQLLVRIFNSLSQQFCFHLSTVYCITLRVQRAYTVWVKKNPPPWNFLIFIPKRLGIFSPNFTRLLNVSIYVGLQLFIQLSATLTKLCHIKRDHHNVAYAKCPPSTETHAGSSHLIWHNFVTVGDNWIKNCILAYIRTFSRRVKFGLKIPNCLGKMSENTSVRFGRWWTFCVHDMNWVVTLNMA